MSQMYNTLKHCVLLRDLGFGVAGNTGMHLWMVSLWGEKCILDVCGMEVQFKHGTLGT